MDKIDIRDLRVGNWLSVYHPTMPAENIQISADWIRTIENINNGLIKEDSPLFRIVNPIPLTREILEKNGFAICNQEYTSETVYYLPGYLFYLETYTREIDPYFHAGCSIVTTRRLGFDRTWMPIMCHIHYVHQLQNILRDLGIEKEITI